MSKGIDTAQGITLAVVWSASLWMMIVKAALVVECVNCVVN